MEPAGFITVASIVLATLIVWARLWVSTAVHYVSKGKSTRTAEVGLAICYLGAFASLAALTIVIFSSIKGDKDIPCPAWILLVLALFLTLVEILGSFISAALRLWVGEITKQTFGPPERVVKWLSPKWVRCLLMALFFLALSVMLGIAVYAMLP
jgi:hypothetical protein